MPEFEAYCDGTSHEENSESVSPRFTKTPDSGLAVLLVKLSDTLWFLASHTANGAREIAPNIPA
jgi:hypothetical protein